MTPHSHHRSSKTLSRWLACAAGALALGASMPGVAGEALDSELASMRAPVETVQPTVNVPSHAALHGDGPLSRADVRESLNTARAANIITPTGEVGDTAEVLQARENFYAAQTEFILARYAAAALQEQALREQLAAAQQPPQETDVLVADLMDSGAVVEQGAALPMATDAGGTEAVSGLAAEPATAATAAEPEAAR